ncbi:MAG: folate family ECF transporter S component [Lachnospiraceae bacterium]|nr:folate family ECF transporter S component [Lachnospiraceae bacterium]
MKKLVNVRIITTAGMLLAAAVVLGFFKIPISQVVEIRLQFLPVAAAGMLLGPFWGGVTGALSDILGYMVRPTGPFFPGFTVSAAIQGVIYGLILHGKEASIRRIILSQAVDLICVSFFLNSLWLSMLYGQGFLAVFTARIIKNLVMFPINTFLLMAVMRPASRAGKLFLT